MSAKKLVKFCRIWLATLLASVMLLGPVVSEAVAETSARTACHASLSPHLEGVEGAHAADPHQEGDNHDPARHHAHSCGGCHVHVLAPAPLIPPEPAKASSHFAWTGDAITGPAPSELFRPPRA